MNDVRDEDFFEAHALHFANAHAQVRDEIGREAVGSDRDELPVLEAADAGVSRAEDAKEAAQAGAREAKAAEETQAARVTEARALQVWAGQEHQRMEELVQQMDEMKFRPKGQPCEEKR